ncbi:MAG TPA: tetratricopeptide repeat protein [Paenibacillaceae bacterium]
MDGETCMRKAYEAIFQGNFEAAVGWFLRALEREPGNADYHYKSSITIARSGRLDLALRLARRAAELSPGDRGYAYHVRVLEARQLTAEAEKLLDGAAPRPVEALRLLRRAAELDPLSAEARMLLAEAYRRLGESGRAADCARQALALRPDLVWAQPREFAVPEQLWDDEKGDADVKDDPGGRGGRGRPHGPRSGQDGAGG